MFKFLNKDLIKAKYEFIKARATVIATESRFWKWVMGVWSLYGGYLYMEFPKLGKLVMVSGASIWSLIHLFAETTENKIFKAIDAAKNGTTDDKSN